MSDVTDAAALVAAWNQVRGTKDPLAALAASGSVGTAMLARLRKRPPNRLSLERRELLREQIQSGGDPDGLARRGELRLQRILPVARAELPTGDFDVVISVRLEVADDLLAGLFATRVLPRRVPAADIPQALLALLRNMSDDVPPGDDVRVGALHFTSAPVTGVGPAGAVRLTQDFRLDIDRVDAGTGRRTNVTNMSGSLAYDARPQADPLAGDRATVAVVLDTALGLGTEELHLDPDSPIQPRSQAAFDAFTAVALTLVVLKIRGQLSALTIRLSPDLTLPFDPALSVRVVGARATTVATERGSGAVNVGIAIGLDSDEATPIVPTVVPRRDVLGRSAATAVVSVHEATLQKLAEASTGTLEDKGNDKIPIFTVRVDSATVQLQAPATIKLTVSARIPDFCGPGPFNFVDLDFDLRLSARVSVFNGTVRLSGDPEVDLDNTDVFVCVVSSAADLVLVSWLDVLLVLGGMVFGKIFAETSDSLGPFSRDLNGVLDPRTPVPGTELVPRGEVLQVGVADHRLELRGDVALIPDVDHIHVYVRVLTGISGVPILNGTPVPGAQVEIMDQDAPRPAGDDFVPPTLKTPEIFHGQTTDVRIDRSFRTATRDERLGSGVTDSTGLARFSITRARAGGSGGTIVTRTIVRHKNVEEDPKRTETTSRAPESHPDVYLRVTLPNGMVVDSRTLDGAPRLALNFDGDHLGTAEQPLRVAVRSGLVAPPEDPTLRG